MLTTLIPAVCIVYVICHRDVGFNERTSIKFLHANRAGDLLKA